MPCHPGLSANPPPRSAFPRMVSKRGQRSCGRSEDLGEKIEAKKKRCPEGGWNRAGRSPSARPGLAAACLRLGPQLSERLQKSLWNMAAATNFSERPFASQPAEPQAGPEKCRKSPRQRPGLYEDSAACIMAKPKRPRGKLPPLAPSGQGHLASLHAGCPNGGANASPLAR
jgi:hypothetical protein